MSSVGADGRGDASPRGDPPGFVAVPDDRTLLIPDRPGNYQLDSYQNVIANSQVGLLFMTPGLNETLRVSGAAEIVTDAELLAPLSVGGKPPVSGLSQPGSGCTSRPPGRPGSHASGNADWHRRGFEVGVPRAHGTVH